MRSVSHDRWSNHDPLDLIEAELVAPAIVELRRARRGVVRHRRGLLKRAAVLEIVGYPRRPETVVAGLWGDARPRRPPAVQPIGVLLRQARRPRAAGVA